MRAPRNVGTTASLVTLTLAIVHSLLATDGRAQGLADAVQEALRNHIESAGTPLDLEVRGRRIYAVQALPTFYERRTYRPAWSDDGGPRPTAPALLRAVRDAEIEGLRPADYHLAAIESLLRDGAARRGGRPWTVTALVDLDLLLSDAFLIYASHLLSGRVNPETIDAQWIASRRERDVAAVLAEAVESGRIVESLRELLPKHQGYHRLRDALARYRAIAAAGGWPTVPEGSQLASGEQGPRVRALRRRLAVTDPAVSAEGALFDTDLEDAVRRFQDRHGLDVDGAVGPATLAALNVPAEERVRQIELNLERWRWLPQELGDRYLIVNIANFELDVVEAGRTLLTMRIVAGRPYRRTPVFSDLMTYLVFNPYWHVPRNLAVQDILPQIKSDTSYLARQRMRVFRTSERGGLEEVDPTTVGWAQVTAENFAFSFRQDPGPANALGRVKFMFPNRFNVYLHDTPTRTLFERSARDFSSGCIRIEKPIELAEYVLAGDPSWTRDRIMAAIATGSEETVRLPQPIPVHLLYWTAWSDDDGSIQFRRDVYDRDSGLYAALNENPPSP
ncbi:MAG: L,D-transpeptidase family protein [Gemmatimonadales bacterium]|jgi:murein L,D-transpeptidase YcbB/YkuD